MRSLNPLIGLAFAIIFGTVDAQDPWIRFDSTNSPLSKPEVNFVAVDEHDQLWAGVDIDWSGSLPPLYMYDGTSWITFDSTAHPALDFSVRAASCDSAGNMWFSIWNHGLLRYDGNDWDLFTTDNSGLLSNDIVNIRVDRTGDMWFTCMASGVVQFDGISWTQHNAQNAPFDEDFNGFSDLFVDQENDVIIADLTAPLRIYHQDIDTWEVVSAENSDIPYNYVAAVSQDLSGRLFVAFDWLNAAPVIAMLEGSEWSSWSPFASPYSWCTYGGLAADKQGGMLAASSSQGLWRFNGGSWSQLNGPPLDAQSSFNSVAVASDGRIWYAARYGIWTQGDLVGLPDQDEGPAPTMINISPVPANDQLTVQVADSHTRIDQLALMDPSGRILRTVTPRTCGPVTWDIREVPPGLCLLVVTQSDGSVTTRRVIIQ